MIYKVATERYIVTVLENEVSIMENKNAVLTNKNVTLRYKWIKIS